MGLFDFIGDIFTSTQNTKAVKSSNDTNILLQREANEANRLQNELAYERSLSSNELAWGRTVEQNDLNYSRSVEQNNLAYSRNVAQSDLAYQRQLEAAQNSVLWRIQDAQRAGVHPLYALGAQGVNLAPSFVGTSGVSGGSPQASGVSAQGSSYGAAQVAPVPNTFGQDIGRAIQAQMTKGERGRLAAEMADLAMYEKNMRAVGFDKALLENDLLRSQIARNQRDQVGPPAPSMVGVKDSSRVQPIPASPTLNSIYDRTQEAGAISDKTYVMTGKNELTNAQSYDFKQRSDEDFVGNRMWDWRNRVAPFFTKNNKTPSTREFPLPKGQAWGYDRWRGSYRPYYTKNRTWVK